jgi:glutamyl-tRNA(Gln) amidotransferase subunit D
MEGPAGYSGEALEFLKNAKAGIGDILEVKTKWGTVAGTLVPRYLYGDRGSIVLKLSSGYNVGLRVASLEGAVVKAKGEKPSFSVPVPPTPRKGLPRVLIIGTGGTIASRVDYRTGAVRPAVSAGELYALIPELSEVARIEPEILFNILSENVEPTHWSKMARRIKKAVDEGVSGVVITHGTDTMGYTAAALSFALQGVPIPVVLVGAQRSSDRPSSDAALNLIGGVSVAADASFSGVYVAMHLDESDDRIAVHVGTRVRKNHTSARAAFESVGVPLAAIWSRTGFEYVREDLPPRGTGGSFNPKVRFDSGAALVKFYPSMPPDFVKVARRSGARCIILEGTGLGHVNSKSIKAIGGFVRKGGLVCMTSQCINGRVGMNVYETGVDLIHAGVVPLEDMLSETALVKAMWVLGNARSIDQAKEKMTRNLAGETTARTLQA